MDSDAESNQDSISDDDFIVDEEGRPIDQRVTAPSIICDEKVQTAREIFGIEFDYDDIAPPGSETDENSYDSEEDQSEDERIEARRRKYDKTELVFFEFIALVTAHSDCNKFPGK